MTPTTLHIITGLTDGGAEAVLFRLCSRDTGGTHHVVSLMGLGKYGPLLEAAGVHVTTLDMPRGRVSLRGLWRLWRLMRHLRPDVVQTWMYHADLIGGVVGRLAGRRRIFWGIRHTRLIPGESSRATILVARICARLSRRVPEGIVCCAEAAAEVHAEMGYDRTRMHVIPNGYDIARFQPDPDAGRAIRRECGLTPDQPVIGFVARYNAQKDHHTLLDALALLKTRGGCPHCLLVGTDIDTGNAELGAAIAERGLEAFVHLLGQRADIPAVMNALDLHVMSSSFGEAFPNVLSEAMACGTPCVTTDVGDAAIIVGETGRIVPPKQPESLAQAIADLLAEHGTAAWHERRGAARQRVIAKFSLERMIARYRAVWAGKAPD